jgi:hypothetical protein
MDSIEGGPRLFAACSEPRPSVAADLIRLAEKPCVSFPAHARPEGRALSPQHRWRASRDASRLKQPSRDFERKRARKRPIPKQFHSIAVLR